jgi:arabinofuranosyltransferase
MSQLETFHVKRQAVIIVAAAFIGAAIYLAWAAATGVWGFALDDGWIHQTYARNLVATGQFAFVPGQPSAGSTSPLWTLLVALGYLVRVDYRWWTYALGTACLAATALGVWRLSWRLFPAYPRAAWAAGILGAVEWHLVWAAVSGMETVLFTGLSIWLMVAVVHPSSQARHSTFDIRHSSFVGLLCGLLVLTRPEGLLLVGLILLVQSVQGVRALSHGQETLRSAQDDGLRSLLGPVWTLLVLAILLAPWLAFNWRASGTLFPNTFYAKQHEYAILLAVIPFIQRVVQAFFVPFISVTVLLIPGLMVAAWTLGRHITNLATWTRLVPLAWAIAHLGLYALRLPVTYQHGRYEMPVIPVLIALGVGGTASLLHHTWRDTRLWPRVLSRAAVLAIAVTQLGFVLLGARAYATDVAIIEGEMVSVARWLAANAAPNDLIAAHDIGAIGYFTRRPLIDLAGLVSPEVIPFIRDEARLGAYIRQRSAAYLVTFPLWYPHLTGDPRLVPSFAGSARESPEHLTVYRLP